MDRLWLIEMFEEAGLESDDAKNVADATLRRILRREIGGRRRLAGTKNLAMHLIRDPLVSVNRIVGKGDQGLPFVDPDSGRLSVAAFGDTMNETGMDPAVSMAYAKVVAEANDPEDLYKPIWKGLGHEDTIDLEVLRRADWTPLRQEFPDLLNTPADPQATRPMIRAKPRARPPVRGRKVGGRGRSLPRRGPARKPK